MLKNVVSVGLALVLGIPLALRCEAHPLPQQGSVLHGGVFVVKLLSPISTKTSRRGDTFSAQVMSPAEYEGAIFEGRINKVRAARKRRKAEISFAFQTITFKGRTIPVQADLKNVANSKGVKDVDDEGHVIGKSSKKKEVAGALIGSGLGALIGGLAAGGKGAAAGAAIGAGAGLIVAIGFTTSGSDIEFAPGSTFTLNVSQRTR